MMTMKEVFKALKEAYVIEIEEKSDTHWFIEDSEYGADVFFDEDGNVIKVQGM